jgi:RNAse (barnase) inhibitor barstar
MNLSLLNRSNYYRGLLVLLRRDRIIDARERELMLQVGKILDFDKRFCEAAIDDLLSNTHITREPLIFSDEHVRECFFRDALRLALVDDCLHPIELRWLRAMAQANNQSEQWLEAIIREFKEKKGSQDQSAPFEIQRYL